MFSYNALPFFRITVVKGKTQITSTDFESSCSVLWDFEYKLR